MPNNCYYNMTVLGEKENIDHFINIMKTDYNYGHEKDEEVNIECEENKHMWRIFEAEADDIMIFPKYYVATISGECAWSVHSCMLRGEWTYNEQFKSKYSTSLLALSKKYDLGIEVYSEECGAGFQEHYLYVRGIELINDCVEWYEMYCEDENFHKYAPPGYDEEFIQVGGFKDFGNYTLCTEKYESITNIKIPNYCYFYMTINGSKKDVRDFIMMLDANNKNKVYYKQYCFSSVPIKLFDNRLNIYKIKNSPLKKLDIDKEQNMQTTIYGRCNWSLENHIINQEKDKYLSEIAKLFNVNIEIYSENNNLKFKKEMYFDKKEGELINSYMNTPFDFFTYKEYNDFKDTFDNKQKKEK